MDGEALSHLPIVSTAVSVLSIKDTWAKVRLKRNVAAFLKALQQGDREEYSRFYSEIGADEKKKEEFITTALDILVEGERDLKATLFGNLVQARSRKAISYEEFDELSLIIVSGSISALRDVPSFFERTALVPRDERGIYKEKLNTSYMVSLGLMDMNTIPQQVNQLGKQLYIYGFRGDVSIVQRLSEVTPTLSIG